MSAIYIIVPTGDVTELTLILAGAVPAGADLLSICTSATLSTGTATVDPTLALKRAPPTADVVQQQSDLMLNYLDLLEQPGAFYVAAHDNVKRKLLAAYFSQIWIDDDAHQITPNTQLQELVAHITGTAPQNTQNEQASKLTLGGLDSSDMSLFFQGA